MNDINPWEVDPDFAARKEYGNTVAQFELKKEENRINDAIQCEQ